MLCSAKKKIERTISHRSPHPSNCPFKTNTSSFQKISFASTYIIFYKIHIAFHFHCGGRNCSGVVSIGNRRSATYPSFNIDINIIDNQIQLKLDFHYGCRFRLRIVSLRNTKISKIDNFWKITLVCLNIYLSTKSFIDLIILSRWIVLMVADTNSRVMPIQNS